MSEPVLNGDLVYKFRRIVGEPNLDDRFGGVVGRCMRVGCGLGVVR